MISRTSQSKVLNKAKSNQLERIKAKRVSKPRLILKKDLSIVLMQASRLSRKMQIFQLVLAIQLRKSNKGDKVGGLKGEFKRSAHLNLTENNLVASKIYQVEA